MHVSEILLAIKRRVREGVRKGRLSKAGEEREGQTDGQAMKHKERVERGRKP